MSSTYAGLHVLVTGGAGFIGSHLVEAVLDEGAESVAIVDTEPAPYAPEDSRVSYIRADIRDDGALTNALGGIDVVFHHGAIASVPECSDRPADAYDVNARGVASLLNSMRRASPKARVVFASSAAVYGNSPQPVANREDAPRTPHSIYGSSKAVGEDVLAMFARVYGVRSAVVRYANVYGPRQPRYIVYDMFHKVLAATETLEVLGSGLQQRDFVYVDDAVRMTLAAALRAGEEPGPFNIGTGMPTTVVDVAKGVASVMNRADLALRTTGNSWLGDVDYLLVDVQRGHERLGPTRTSFESGLQSTVTWFMKHDGITPA